MVTHSEVFGEMKDVTALILFWTRECGGFSPGKPWVWKVEAQRLRLHIGFLP